MDVMVSDRLITSVADKDGWTVKVPYRLDGRGGRAASALVRVVGDRAEVLLGRGATYDKETSERLSRALKGAALAHVRSL